jgi:glycerophosphoryl diester phosphodiesterase
MLLRNSIALIFTFLLYSMTARAVEIIAHRGASAEAPENTLPAIQLAWEQGADAIELDLYLSKDGKIIIFHDTTTKRYDGQDRKVADLTLEEARQLDVGSWKGEKWRGLRIPPLEEVLATIPQGKRAVLEIKCGPELARVLKPTARPAAETCVICFNHDALAASKKALPALQHYFLQGWKKDTATGKAPELAPLIEKAKAAGFDGLNLAQEWPIDAASAATVALSRGLSSSLERIGVQERSYGEA